eukprot:scaffold260785_cov31-Tisochrysis_lutea.AAC.5
MTPRMRPRERPRISSISTCSTGSLEAVAMCENVTVRSALGPMRWKSVSVRHMSVIFSLRKLVLERSAGCCSSFAWCCATSASYLRVAGVLVRGWAWRLN